LERLFGLVTVQATNPEPTVEPAGEEVPVVEQTVEEKVEQQAPIAATGQRIANLNVPAPSPAPVVPASIPAALGGAIIIQFSGVEVGRMAPKGGIVPVDQYAIYDEFWHLRGRLSQPWKLPEDLGGSDSFGTGVDHDTSML
jgi:hypothetical protein